MKIYTDGATNFTQVTEKDVHKIVQAPTGVDIIKKDGSIKHVLDATTDGIDIYKN